MELLERGGLLNLFVPLMKNVLTLPAKTIFPALWVTVADSAVDTANQKNILGSRMTTLMISKGRNGWYHENS